MRYVVFFVLVMLFGSCDGGDVTERMVRDFSITGNDTNVARIGVDSVKKD